MCHKMAAASLRFQNVCEENLDKVVNNVYLCISVRDRNLELTN